MNVAKPKMTSFAPRHSQPQQQQEQQDQQPPKVMKRLNLAVQQQLNLESVKTKAISLFKAIMQDIKKVSKAFVVHPKNVNDENAAIFLVMMSSKLLPEIEADDNSKREQLLYAMQNLSVPLQIKKLKARIDMIGAACESAEKVIADNRKTYFGTRQGPTNIMTLDNAQAAKI
uniref:Uncharacterized protein n=1 Tax=Tanacetum cinerariifolium TaxID=118510 RepID=A0A6L2KRL3_TANCI|nr:hypothetical protein [Tanacetum cinerariifolium]